MWKLKKRFGSPLIPKTCPIKVSWGGRSINSIWLGLKLSVFPYVQAIRMSVRMETLLNVKGNWRTLLLVEGSRRNLRRRWKDRQVSLISGTSGMDMRKESLAFTKCSLTVVARYVQDLNKCKRTPG